MKIEEKQYKTKQENIINYYEIENNKEILLMIHGQGTKAMSYRNVIKKLSKSYHLILVDCYGHGKSTHKKELYNLESIGNDLIEFINEKIKTNISIVGHSSGGLIAAYIASNCEKCTNLFLEDPPFFSSQGEQRKKSYNYKDLSTVCHNFINQKEEKDFPYYYFINQYCWNFFPEESRDKLRNKLGQFAKSYRTKHPDKTLKVLFWPKKFMEAYYGLNEYDPYFGENFYNNQFNKEIEYEKLLSNIKCNTIFMKAKAPIGPDGTIQGALGEEDLAKVVKLIKNCKVVRFDCSHGIHSELPKKFISTIIEK